jgi:CheY-like chemotaxis protein
MEIDPHSVLIVDDDDLLRDALAALLRERGYIVAAAKDHRRALEFLDGDTFAVALVDLRMKGMGGMEIIRKIRTFSPPTQCIVLTGHASRESAIEAVNLGAYSYLSKPCEIGQLLLTVRRASEHVENEQALGRERTEKIRRVEARTRALTAENAELHRKLKVKDRFLLGLARTLRTELEGVGPTRLDLAPAAADAKRLKRLIAFSGDLLSLARIQTGEWRPEVETVSVSDLLRRCAAALAAEAPDAPPPEVLDVPAEARLGSDAEMAERAILELARAARERSAGRPVSLGAGRTDDRVRFTVSDSGPPLADAALSRLNGENPFPETADGPAPPRLGPLLAWRLVAALGGQVSVESRSGGGNRFILSLPDHRFPERPGEPAPNGAGAPHSPETRRPRLVLAEDNPESAEVISDYLRSKGFAVQTAGTGREVLEAMREAPADLVLMDVQMPDLDGLEAIRRIRADPEIRFVPIVAVTALAMAGDRERCLAAGANAYMSKPLRLRSLIETVESFLSPSPENENGRRTEHSDR